MVKPPPPFYAASTFPPAFASLQLMDAKLEENRSEIERIRSEMTPYDSDRDYLSNILNYLHERTSELTYEHSEAFAKILVAECSEGNFEIFERPLPLSPFLSSEFYIFLQTSSKRSEVLQHLSKVEPSPHSFDWLVGLHEGLDEYFDPASIAVLSKSFQESISWSLANGDKIGGLSRNPMVNLIFDGRLRDQDLVDLFDFLYSLRKSDDPGIFERILARKVKARVRANPRYLETLKFPDQIWTLESNPVMVKLFNPSFFNQEFKTRGIDPAVLDLISPAWEGNFGSLLESAASLSAEQA